MVLHRKSSKFSACGGPTTENTDFHWFGWIQSEPKIAHKNTPPCLSRIVNKGGKSYVSAGRRPKNLTILEAKMLLKVCFCSGNRCFCIGKDQNFPPAAGQQHKISIFIDFGESNLSPKLHTRIPPLVCPRSSTRGGILKWNSPDRRITIQFC